MLIDDIRVGIFLKLKGGRCACRESPPSGTK